jgi:hypothetical protein
MLPHLPSEFEARLVSRRAEKGTVPQACHEALLRCSIDPAGVAIEKLVFLELSIWVEQEGQQESEMAGEHAYHNRQHLGDVITALSFFLECDHDLSSEDKTLCLIAMLLHDFRHEGAKANRLNINSISQEQKTVDQLKHPIMSKLSPAQLQKIKDCILGTQFSSLKELHEAYLANPMDSFLRMQAYINEADISASLTQALGFPLTRLFMVERDGVEPTLIQMQNTLQRFHRECLISTPVAKHYLNRI